MVMGAEDRIDFGFEPDSGKRLRGLSELYRGLSEFKKFFPGISGILSGCEVIVVQDSRAVFAPLIPGGSLTKE